MADVFSSSAQVEKTKHFLLLREKLESTLFLGQESLQSCITEELKESTEVPEAEQGAGLSSEITTERQRELATKVSYHLVLFFPLILTVFNRFSFLPDKMDPIYFLFCFSSVFEAAHSLLQQRVQPCVCQRQ